jgi:SpoIID/LytB domain protein
MPRQARGLPSGGLRSHGGIAFHVAPASRRRESQRTDEPAELNEVGRLSRRRLLKVIGSGAGLTLTGAHRLLAQDRDGAADEGPISDAGTAADAATDAATLPDASLVDAGVVAPEPAAELAPDPNDPIAILYGRRLAFADGAPQVTVRILEGRSSFTFVPNGPVRIGGRDARLKPATWRSPGRWTVCVADSRPGRSVVRVQVGEHLFEETSASEADAALFKTHGYNVSLVNAGSVYGIAGRTVDTRHVLVLVEGDGTETAAARLADELSSQFALRPEIHREPVERGHGMIEVIDPSGQLAARGPDALSIDIEGGCLIERVEHSIGYPEHGFEDRRYANRLFAAVDSQGLLAAVTLVPLETLAKGIVPSEIFVHAHMEALKAQAVTARGEILAKVGARHVGDPYLLCAEQHCQVFRGTSGETQRTSAAVDATRGEALFAPAVGSLVPSYYSAICGGHTEDNDKVWGGPPNPSIRGRPDFPLTPRTQPFAEGIGEALLRRWLATDVPSYCRTASVAKADRYRWKRSFTQAEVNAIAAPYDVGAVTSLDVDGRGISGRARTLVLRGTQGEARIHTELSIRRLFRMLPSGMFVVDARGAGAGRAWVFQGGGWGHGAGMCQFGAIGRAEKGASYRDILRTYFSGAEVVRMYG